MQSLVEKRYKGILTGCKQNVNNINVNNIFTPTPVTYIHVGKHISNIWYTPSMWTSHTGTHLEPNKRMHTITTCELLS